MKFSSFFFALAFLAGFLPSGASATGDATNNPRYAAASALATARLVAADMLAASKEFKNGASRADASTCEEKLEEAARCFEERCDPRGFVAACERAAKRIASRERGVNLRPVLDRLDLLSKQAEDRHTELMGAIEGVSDALTLHDEETQAKLDAANAKLDRLIQQGLVTSACEAKARAITVAHSAGVGADTLSILAKSLETCMKAVLEPNALATLCVEEGRECSIPLDGGRMLFIDPPPAGSHSNAYTAVKWAVPMAAGAVGMAALCGEQDEGPSDLYDCAPSALIGLVGGALISGIWELAD